MRQFENRAENSILRQIDRSIEKQKEDILFDENLIKEINTHFEEKIFKKRPVQRDFIGTYDAEVLMADNNIVKREKARHEFNDKELKRKEAAAHAFEGIVMEESMKSAWLGRDAKVTPTSEYDDFVNHVDAVAEIHSQTDGAQHLGLAIDVTFTGNEDMITKKLDVIKRNIMEGRAPAKIKYFIDSEGKKKAILIPKVVIGADADTVRELVAIFKDKLSKDERVWKEAQHKLNFHPFQTKMLLEISAQLKAFGDLAFKYENPKTGGAYYKAKKIIESVIREKTLFNEQKNSQEIRNDKVVQTILKYSRDLY